MSNENLYLVYIEPIGKNLGLYRTDWKKFTRLV